MVGSDLHFCTVSTFVYYPERDFPSFLIILQLVTDVNLLESRLWLVDALPALVITPPQHKSAPSTTLS